MNQKTTIVLVLVAIAAIFLALLVFSAPDTQTKIGEPVTPSEMEVEEVTEEPEVAPAPTMPQGKIDVRVACESALMYTSFTDGAAADAYVQDCIDGKHPEVIERYISEMGVDGAVI